LPKIVEISPWRSKLQLAKVGVFSFETVYAVTGDVLVSELESVYGVGRIFVMTSLRMPVSRMESNNADLA